MKFPVIPVSSGLIIQNNKVLIGLRSEKDNGGGLWEFPGGKIEINESRFGPIYKNRGYVRQQQNKIDDAKQDYQNYIKFTPNAKDRGMIERALNEM